MESAQLMKRIISGAAGGAAGSLAMDAMRFVGEKTGLIHKRTLPHQLEKEMEQRAGVDRLTSATQEMVLTQAMHIGLGAGFGAAYSLLLWQTVRRSVLPTGLVYGLAVYALDLLALGPAFSLTTGPWNQPPLRAGRRLLSHLIFGVVTVAVSGQVKKRLAPVLVDQVAAPAGCG